jgi:tRNA/tmRNA/rRNA uracil-C5-methylase (TrmA/RlmC/RlmD family)
MTSTLTATQLRNARKRRALKRTKSRASTESAPTKPRKRRRPSHPTQLLDPSQLYIDNPYAAPIVKAAQRFFQDVSEQQKKLHRNTGRKNQLGNVSSTIFPIHLGPKHGWRTVVKLPVRGENPPKIGLFVPGSHLILPVVDLKTQQCLCSTHHPVINRAIVLVQRFLNESSVTAYSEQTGKGLLRHVALSLERHTQRVQLVLVWNDDDNKSFSSSGKNLPLLKALWQALVPPSEASSSSNPTSSATEVKWHSIWVHYNNLSKHSNAIYKVDGPWELLYSASRKRSEKKEDESTPPVGVTEYLNTKEGSSVIEASPSSSSELLLPPVPLHFPPQVFRQGNLTAFAKIVASIRRYWIQSDLKVDKCLELYGGVGTIGLHLVDMCGKQFLGSDENPYNVACFEASTQSLQRPNTVVRYVSASASEMVLERKEHLSANAIIVDPPRKGLDAAVARALTWSVKPRAPIDEQQPQTLFYVSCGFEAFTRDYAVLTDPSAPLPWTLQLAEGHILFPGSDAIETLAIFAR